MIISIDGLDGSGKETLTKALGERLNAEVISFPYYDSDTGSDIKKLLAGKYKTSGPIGTGMLFANNRKEYFKKNGYPDKNKNYIFDRYTVSNVLYQGITYDKKILKYFIDYFNGLEYEDMLNPQPDYQFLLNVPYDILRERLDGRTINKNGMENDNYEKDNFLKKVYQKSQEIINDKKLLEKLDLTVINGVENGNLLTPNQLVDKIVNFMNIK